MKKFAYTVTALLVFATCSASTIKLQTVTIGGQDKTTTQPKPTGPDSSTDSQGPPSCDRGVANGCGIFD